MKMFYKTVLTVLILTGCGKKTGELNQFSSSNDTLIIRTEKQKGDGLFALGAGPLNFKDTTEAFPYPVIFPGGLKNIKRAQIVSDFKPKDKHYVDIMKGVKGTERIFIVDENNNNDFTDDSLRVLKEIKWDSWKELIKCNFLISNGHKIIKDSSWIRIGTHNGRTLYGKNEHLVAKFNVDRENFKIGIIDPVAVTTFTYDYEPEVALLADNNAVRDTLLKGDLLKKGEFLKLNNLYYRFEDISNNGEYITLIKEKEIDNKIGTQIGLIAPNFECVSTKGNIIKSAELSNRVTIIANSCGCGGDKLSLEAYFHIKEAYGEEMNIIRLDSRIKEGLDGIHIDMENEFNKDMYNKYRNTYCSRVTYVIGKNKRIIDKFQITNWKLNLPQLVK